MEYRVSRHEVDPVRGTTGRSLKYEDIYLKSYADGREAKAGIADWLAFYNHRRPHQARAAQSRTPIIA